MGKLRVGVDMDNILNDLIIHWIKYLNKKHDLDVNISDINEWELTKAYPTLTEAQILEPLFLKEFWVSTLPLKDSQLYMGLLCKAYDVFIVSASHWDTIAWKVEWLKKYYPFINTNNIIIMNQKQMLNIDILVDDALHNLIGATYNKILLDYPWNRDTDDYKYGIKRVYCWNGIYREINNITENLRNEEFNGENNY